MGVYAAGEVVFLTFPFSDLSQNKLRPALLLVDAGQGDWIACQITSNPYIDRQAVELNARDFLSGGLARVSYVRASKLFTANESLFAANSGMLTAPAFRQAQNAVIDLIRRARI